MSKKTLAVKLSKLKPFFKPKQNLEQYPTDSDVGATALWEADLIGWINGKEVADLGAGTGILGLGCLLMGAKNVFFVEKDADCLVTLKENIQNLSEEYELGKYEIVNKDISHFEKKVDLVVMNPPFGTKIKGADMKFLEIAMLISDKIVSFHKTETSDYISKFVHDRNYTVNQKIDLPFALKNTMSQHKKRIERISVTAWLIERKP